MVEEYEEDGTSDQVIGGEETINKAKKEDEILAEEEEMGGEIKIAKDFMQETAAMRLQNVALIEQLEKAQ